MEPSKVIPALEKAGLNIQPYRRGPFGSGVFSIAKTPSGDGLRVWVPESADIDLYTDKRKKQAVISVLEKAREVRNNIRIWEIKRDWDKYIGKDVGKISWDALSEDAKEYFSQYMTHGTNIYVPNSRFVPSSLAIEHLYSDNASTIVYIYGVSKAKRNRNTFLIGQDEEKHFVSVLRKRVYSVDEAHESLRPKGLSKNAIRQGEWFFDPVTKKKERELKKLLQNKNFHFAALEGEHSWRPRNRSSHRAMILTEGRDKYVYGPVIDSRKGYHAPLLLDGFHKVVRNREVKVEPSVRNYD